MSRLAAPVLLLVAGCSAVNLGNMNPFKDFSKGGTTYRAAIAFQCAERGPESIIGRLEALAADTDTEREDGIARLAGDAALDLLRQKNQWVACSGTAQHYADDDQARFFGNCPGMVPMPRDVTHGALLARFARMCAHQPPLPTPMPSPPHPHALSSIGAR